MLTAGSKVDARKDFLPWIGGRVEGEGLSSKGTHLVALLCCTTL